MFWLQPLLINAKSGRIVSLILRSVQPLSFKPFKVYSGED